MAITLVPAAAGTARRAAEGVTRVLTTPIYGRSTVMQWDEQQRVWVRDNQERTVTVTPAGLLAVGGLVAATAFGLWLMGARAKVLTLAERQAVAAVTAEGVGQRELGIVADRARLEAAVAALARAVDDLRGAGQPTAANPTVLGLEQAVARAEQELAFDVKDLAAFRRSRQLERIPFRWDQRSQATFAARLFG